MIRNNCGFDFSAEGDRLTVSVGGEIDHHGAAPLRDGIDALIWEYRPKHLTLICRAWSLWTARGWDL